MERGGQQIALTDGHDSTGVLARGDPPDRRSARADVLHPRRPDEDRAYRLAGDAVDVEVLLEGVDLSAERVAPDGDVDSAERLGQLLGTVQPVGEQDHPGARAVGGHALLDPRTE